MIGAEIDDNELAAGLYALAVPDRVEVAVAHAGHAFLIGARLDRLDRQARIGLAGARARVHREAIDLESTFDRDALRMLALDHSAPAIDFFRLLEHDDERRGARQ